MGFIWACLRRKSVTWATRGLASGGGCCERGSPMPECRPFNDAQPLGIAARCNTIHDRSLPGLLLIALLCGGDAVADEHASNPGAAPGSTVAGFFTLPKDAGTPTFSS